MATLCEALGADGFVWFRGALDETELIGFDEAINLSGAPGKRFLWTKRLRGLLDQRSTVGRLANDLLRRCSPVRMIGFDKSAASNWAVPWHQDRVIAVKSRHDVAGFSAWTRQNLYWHCEPPIRYLEHMIFARIHLDDCDAANGAMKIIPRSHRHGRLADEDLADIVKTTEPEICAARRGDVLFAKALIVHGSSASQSATRRRALRVDYSADGLPHPLEWAL